MLRTKETGQNDENRHQRQERGKNSWGKMLKRSWGRDRWERTTEKAQLGKVIWKGQLGKDTRKGQLGRESLDRTAGTRQWEKIVSIVQAGQERKCRTAKIWQQEQDTCDRTTGMGNRGWTEMTALSDTFSGMGPAGRVE
jgi:hypothetical protein